MGAESATGAGDGLLVLGVEGVGSGQEVAFPTTHAALSQVQDQAVRRARRQDTICFALAATLLLRLWCKVTAHPDCTMCSGSPACVWRSLVWVA